MSTARSAGKKAEQAPGALGVARRIGLIHRAADRGAQLLGQGVCTHPERTQIESLLARGVGISAIEPLMRDAFSRRALYRHRAKHMIGSGLPAAHPVPFPFSASPLTRVKWLQREIEHTAALAEHQGNLSLKLKTLHELGRFIWLEEA